MLLKLLIAALILLTQLPNLALQTNVLFHRTHSTIKHVREVTPAPPDPIEIFLFGDVMLGRYIATLRSYSQNTDPTFPLTNLPEIISTYTDDPEVVAVNLEGPISDFQISYCELCFRFLPEVSNLLTAQGVTFANLANNHIFNQGEEGYEQTKSYLVEEGINYVGHAREVNNFSSYIQDIGGLKIGWLGFDDIDGSLDYEAATQKAQETAEQADFTILAIHWGTEYVNIPSETIQEHAHQFIDAGVDVVWGTHPHVIQSIENYGDGMIFYSLGNFVFDQYWSAGTQEGLGVMIEIPDKNSADDPIYNLIPLKLTDNRGDPYLMEEDQKQDMLSRLQQYSETIGVIADEMMNFAEGVLRPW